MRKLRSNLYSLLQGKSRKVVLAAMPSVVLIFSLLVMAASCEKPEKFPMDVSFTEYSLEGTSCQWTNLNYNKDLIVINSNEELENYISCSDGSYIEIDFSKYTLLLASGQTRNAPIEEITKKLTKTAKNEYDFDIDVTTGNLRAITPWLVAITVSKISDDAVVSLNVNEHYYDYNYDN